jgi:hypothetical protein
MDYIVTIQDGGFTEGTDEETGERVVTFHVSNHLEIPVEDDQHQWEVWKTIVEGFESSPHWDILSTNEGYRSYQHRDFRSRVMRVFTFIE